jgi:hypothetical protein
MADLVAGELATLHKEIRITTFTAHAEALLTALVPAGQWVWKKGSELFTGSLRHSMQRLHYQIWSLETTIDSCEQQRPDDGSSTTAMLQW